MKTHSLIGYMSLVLPFFLVACSGGRMTLGASNLEHPVSTSQGLYDPKFTLLGQDDYEVVGKVDFTVSKWTLFWSLVPLSSDPDLSQTLDSEIKAKGGDAIVNLTVTTGTTLGGGVIVNFFSSIVPVLPGIVAANITGDIVKAKH